ncbi:hypothetical protein GCM10022284_75990 [Streptomyces hundungensis]
MTRLSVAATGLTQGARPDGPLWFKWAFLAVWLVLAPVVIYKLYQHGYFRRRHRTTTCSQPASQARASGLRLHSPGGAAGRTVEEEGERSGPAGQAGAQRKPGSGT